MAHLPINHHLRPLYRALTLLAGVYVLVLGAIGIVKTSGLDLFAQPGEAALPWVLGLRMNPAFAYLSVAAGLVMVAAAVIGRNLDYYANLVAAGVFMVIGTAMLALLQTDANILGFSMSNVVVSYILGMVAMTAGLYGKVGTPEQAQAEEAFRHR